MRMKIPSGLLTVALLLASSPPALATLKNIEQAYELRLSQVTLPDAEQGTLVVRPCAACKPQVLNVTAATLYVVRPGKSPVSLRELTKAAKMAAGRDNASAYVYYQPATRHVTRLVLDPAK